MYSIIAAIASQYQLALWIIQCLHILWYVVIILDRAPSQHLTRLTGLHAHSCHLSLKQRHVLTLEAKRKTGASIKQKYSMCLKQQEEKKMSAFISLSWISINRSKRDIKVKQSSFLYQVLIRTHNFSPCDELCHYQAFSSCVGWVHRQFFSRRLVTQLQLLTFSPQSSGLFGYRGTPPLFTCLSMETGRCLWRDASTSRWIWVVWNRQI